MLPVPPPLAAAPPADDGQLVASVSDDGKVVVLEDGSVWVIDDMDMVVSVTWPESNDVVGRMRRH